jgi:hypothetical protein
VLREAIALLIALAFLVFHPGGRAHAGPEIAAKAAQTQRPAENPALGSPSPMTETPARNRADG